MTDEVATLVLADNIAEANVLEIASVEASALVGVHAGQIERLEQTAGFDRALEGDAHPQAAAGAGRGRAGAHRAGARGAARLHKLELERELVASTCPTIRTCSRARRLLPDVVRERSARRSSSTACTGRSWRRSSPTRS